ncbi:MAG: hypothetical protein PF961_11865, partial [Planctomycetota bacterium]|nr:hypothetical protein [Planctomycetota bacterium]
ADGSVVARRRIGANTASGCRGPDAVTVAVRQAGAYTVQVRWSDGAESSMPVDISANTLTTAHIAR